MKNSFFICSALAFLLFTNCQSKPKFVDDGSDTGVWEGKVQMSDTSNRKKIYGQVTWRSDSTKKRLRVDVQAVFGIPVATFVLQNGVADLWLHQEEKHFQSKNPEKLFANLIRFPLDPQIFFALLSKSGTFRKPWNCLRPKGQVHCDNRKKGVMFTLMNQIENRRNITIKKETKVLQMAMTRTKVQVQDKAFITKSFPHYKQIRI